VAHTYAVKALAVLLTGELVSSSYDNSIKVWTDVTVADPQVKATLLGHTDSINAIAVTKNGNLVSGSYDFTLRLWDMTTYQQIQIAYTTQVFAIAVLQNGTVAYGVREGIIHFADPISLNETSRFTFNRIIYSLKKLLYLIKIQNNKRSFQHYLGIDCTS